MENGQNLEI